MFCFLPKGSISKISINRQGKYLKYRFFCLCAKLAKQAPCEQKLGCRSAFNCDTKAFRNPEAINVIKTVSTAPGPRLPQGHILWTTGQCLYTQNHTPVSVGFCYQSSARWRVKIGVVGPPCVCSHSPYSMVCIVFPAWSRDWGHVAAAKEVLPEPWNVG